MVIRQLSGLLLVASLFSGVSMAAPHSGAHHERGADFDETAALEFSQAAIGRTVGDYHFTDADGGTLRLQDFRGRPLVISLIYTSCYHTCPTLTSHLANAVEVAREALGEQSFSVLTIGFDVAVDTPERMRIYARERGIEIPDWHFVGIDAQSIEPFVNELGFIFFPSAKGFDHLAQTTVLDAEGRVYRQVYGDTFSTPSLVEPLKQLVFGTRADVTSLDGWINSVRLFCTIYDPTSGKYHFDYSIFVGIFAGLLSLGGVAIFLVRAWRQSGEPGSGV